jgi:hypothetical protein
VNTPSHLILTAAIRKASPAWRMPASAVLIGSVAPDLPLTVVSLAAFGYFKHIQGWPVQETFEHMYGTLYFNDPGWMAAHNLLHAPFMILVGLLVCRWWYGRDGFGAGWWTWFLASCLLHCTVDVFTHFDDGPLLLFPFEWSVRYASPVSYWDSAHYGAQFFAFEVLLDAALLTYLLAPKIAERVRGWREQREAA